MSDTKIAWWAWTDRDIDSQIARIRIMMREMEDVVANNRDEKVRARAAKLAAHLRQAVEEKEPRENSVVES